MDPITYPLLYGPVLQEGVSDFRSLAFRASAVPFVSNWPTGIWDTLVYVVPDSATLVHTMQVPWIEFAASVLAGLLCIPLIMRKVPKNTW